MTQTEYRKIEKALIDKINNSEVGSVDHRTALGEWLKFSQQYENVLSERTKNELENARVSNEYEAKCVVERQRIESQETVAKCQRDLEERKLQQEKEIAEENAKLERRAKFWLFFGGIIAPVVTGSAMIANTIIANNRYERQLRAVCKYEETGTVRSMAGKQMLSGLKPPKH